MQFRILGPLEVLEGGRPVALPRGRGRALLARLILDAGTVVPTERLVDDLWGEVVPYTVQTALQGLVWNLRKRLEPARSRGEAPELLRTVPPGYLLAVDPACVDANRFRRLLEEARAAEPAERVATLRQALGLWRGRALADFAYEPFAQREIATLEALRLAAIEERIDADLAVGRASEVVTELDALVTEHPLQERLRGQLMLALYRAGRQADALHAYRDARRTLIEELGIEPGPALRQLEQAILRQEPSLDVEPPQAPAKEVATEPAAARWLAGERRPVTVVFVDIAAPSTGDGVDDEALRPVLGRSLELAADVLRRHGASVEELVGDVLVGLFGLPAAHEDDALRAVRAVDEMRGVVNELNEGLARERGIRLSIRAGVETGEVVTKVPDSRPAPASGEAVHAAARLQHAAREGEVLVGEATRRVLRDSVVLEPADAPRPDAPGTSRAGWRLIDVVPDTPAVARRLDVPIVGRQDELAHLRAAFDRTVRSAKARRVVVLGDAGIGKSRLALELATQLRSRAAVLTGRCLPYGEGITFAPLREIVLQAMSAGGTDDLAELLSEEADGWRIANRVGAAIGLTQEPTPADELFPATRRFLEALSERQPLVVVFEDLHWAEATLLELIAYLADSVRGRVLLLCMARPELIEDHPAWEPARLNAETLILESLGLGEIELIAERAAGGALGVEVRARVVETAQGNPLFAEQLVAAFQEGATVSVPASVQALLAARLDRLGPAERDVLRCAAVVGTDFTVDALIPLVPEEAHRFVGRHLEALERKQLIRLSRDTRQLGFRHVLIQLAAYRSMTRWDRARLHESFANWLREEAPKRSSARDETLGYHLEQAVAERRALSLSEEHDAELAVRAGEHLAVAGLRAAWRYDVAAAANLLSRAYAILPATNPQRRTVMQRLAEAYQVVGRLEDAESVLTRMLNEANADGDRPLAQIARLELMRAKLFGGPDPINLQSIRDETDQALDLFREPADDAGLALAYYVRAYVHFRAAEAREMERAARLALVHADRSARRREMMAARMLVAWAIAAGPTPVPEAVRICEQLVEVAGREHPMVLSELAILRAMLGEFDDARALLERARGLAFEQMRGRSPMLILALAGASMEREAGELDAEEHELEVALELARDGRLRDTTAQTAARLSLAVVRRDPARAEQLASLSREEAPAQSVAAQALWRTATARSKTSSNPDGEAGALATDALRFVPTEMPNLRADLLVELAEILWADEDATGATRATGEAIELYERKGNLVAAARARSSWPGATRVKGRASSFRRS